MIAATIPPTDNPLPPDLIALLAAVNPVDLDWHAAHYDGGDQFRRMVIAASNPDGPPPTISDFLRACAACVDDGGSYGFMGCVGGTARDVWRALLAHYRVVVPHF